MGLESNLRVQDWTDMRATGERKVDTRSAFEDVIAQLDEALGHLEVACRSSRDRENQLRLEQEQRSEQHVQALRVQSDHWRGEAERQAAILTRLRERETSERDKIDDLEADLAQWRNRAAHWQREAEKHASALTELRVRETNECDKIDQLATELAQWRHKATQWQEKAESWKEEARRSEEARVAALHRVGSADVKALASEMSATIDDAVTHIREVLARRKFKAEG